MCVLLEEVVLDLPDVLEAELVGELDLLEDLLEELLLVSVVPRPREVVLVEESEFHVASLLIISSTTSHAFSKLSPW